MRDCVDSKSSSDRVKRSTQMAALTYDRATPTCTLNAPQPPLIYELRFFKFMDMSREMWNELEDDNK